MKAIVPPPPPPPGPWHADAHNVLKILPPFPPFTLIVRGEVTEFDIK